MNKAGLAQSDRVQHRLYKTGALSPKDRDTADHSPALIYVEAMGLNPISRSLNIL